MADTLTTTCVNAECGSKLYGPVKFCPYCGQPQQKVAAELRVAEPPPPLYDKKSRPARTETEGEGRPLEVKEPAQPVPPTPPKTVEPMLEVDWEPSSPPIAAPAEPNVPAQQPKEPVQRPAVIDAAPPELAAPQPRSRVGAYIAGAVIAVGAYAAWSIFIQKPTQPAAVPPVIEQPSATAQEPMTVPSNPPPQEPGPPSAIERRLAQAQECLQAGDYGCSWRAVRFVLEREPDIEAALAIEDEINSYVDQKVVLIEQALEAKDLANARAALADAQKAKNFDHSDPRLDELSRRLDERQQSEQRAAAEVSLASTPSTVAAGGPDPMIQEYLSEAQQSLERGNLDAAESFANKALNLDAANPVAPEILRRVETEKERIKAILRGSTEVKEAVKVNR